MYWPETDEHGTANPWELVPIHDSTSTATLPVTAPTPSAPPPATSTRTTRGRNRQKASQVEPMVVESDNEEGETIAKETSTSSAILPTVPAPAASTISQKEREDLLRGLKRIFKLQIASPFRFPGKCSR